MTTLAQAYAEHGIPEPKKQQARPEHSLQTHLKALVREYLATAHMFAAHDRTQRHYATQHIREKARGLVSGWPDIEVPLLGGLTFRCELKAAGAKVADNSEQARIIRELNDLGHPTAWANSAAMFVRVAKEGGVPFRIGVERKAQAIDDMLAEWARRRELVAPKKKRAPRARKEPPQQGALNVMARARTKGVYA